MIVQVSQTILQPTEEFQTGSEIILKVWYTRTFVAGDGVTPVIGGNGKSGFFDQVTCSVNGSGFLVIPAFNVQATVESNPTAGFFGQLYVDGAAANVIFGGQAQSGWAIPVSYGSIISYDELATYNRAKTLVYPPVSYFTADQTIQEIRRLSGDLNYAGVGILGRTQLDTAPAITSVPIAVGINSDLLFNNTHLIPATNVLTPQLYGAFADGTIHAITSQDITNNPQWIGSYTVGDSWDYVAVQEAIYHCFATNSTPGNVIWNATSGATYRDRPLYFPQGRYYINKQLTTVANGFNIYGCGKLATFIQWYGAADLAMWYCDAIAYGTLAYMTLQAKVSTSEALLEMDWTGVHTGILKTNNISLYDMQVDMGSGVTAAFGVRISKSGSNAQGDTINLNNTSFVSDNTASAGLALGFNNAQNVLGINLFGGGFIGCSKDGIAVIGGQVFVYGTFFGNQSPSESATLKTQICRGGADVHIYSGAGVSGLSSMHDIRSESDVLSIGVAHLDHCSLVGDSIDQWFASSSYQVGQLIHGTPGVGQKGAAGRTFMMVASVAGTAYITPSGTSTWDSGTHQAVIIDPSASYTVNQWVGYGLTIRYPNGFLSTAIVSANTATTVTATPIAFDYHTCPGSVCCSCSPTACGQPDITPAFPCSQYRIGGISGGTEPTWNSCPTGYNGMGNTGSGGNITQGDTTFTAAYMGGNPQVGDYVMLTGAGTDGAVLISRVASVNSTVSVELADVAGTTVADSQFYIGTPITDGSLMWIDVDYNVVSSPLTVKALYANAGRVSGATSATIYGSKFARQDWLRAKDFENGAGGDNEYPSFIYNNTVHAGDLFSAAAIKYNLFQGTAGGFQQYAPLNMASGMMLFDSGENTSLLGEVGFGRGDGKSGLTPGTAEYITRNTAGIIGALTPPAVVGSDQSNVDLILQGGISTGSGTPGSISLRVATAGGSSSTPNNSAEIAKFDHSGFHLPVIAFASIGAPADGTMIYCSDGNNGVPLTGGGTGCLAVRVNGGWVGY